MKKTQIALVASTLTLAANAWAYTEYNDTMHDVMGVNTSFSLWNDYLKDGEYDNIEIEKAFRWVRNYQRWDFFERENDVYFWNDDTGGKKFWFDEYYRRLNELDINILVVPTGVPNYDYTGTGVTAWHPGTPHLPVDNGDGSEPDHYRERAEFLAQMAARYGPTGGHTETRLETDDKVQGLDYVRYFEDANEPNQTTNDIIWPGELFGHWSNAAHDGRGVARNGSMPIAGIKQGDPNAVHVLAGMVGNGVEDNYWGKLTYAAGRNAFDILNMHMYCRSNHLFPFGTYPWPPEAVGTSPEYYVIESGLDEIQNAVRWRDQFSPGTPIWLTEFGWDTTIDINGTHSVTYAPEQAQANYILRTFPLVKLLGIDKAFLYFDFDGDTSKPGLFASSGMVTDRDTGHQPKISYYYMTAMSAAVGEYHLDGAYLFAVGDPNEVYAYSFSKSDDDIVVMAFCREKDSHVDNGTTISNYVLNVPNMATCELTTPTDNVVGGVQSSLTVNQPSTANANVTIPLLSETPVFLKITGTDVRLNVVPQVYAGSDVEFASPLSDYTFHAEASDADGTVVSYQWTQISGPTATMSWTSTADMEVSNLGVGEYVFEVSVTDDDGGVGQDRVVLLVADRQPYLSGPHAIPGLIEAEDFDDGGEGVSYHDNDVGNYYGEYRTDVDVDINDTIGGGYHVTGITTGDWLKYSVDVQQSGYYRLEIHIEALVEGKRVSVEIDGNSLTGYTRIGKVDVWGDFPANIVEPVWLDAGEHVMRILFVNGNSRFDSIEIVPFEDPYADGEYYRFSVADASKQTKRLFYETKWNDDVDVTGSGNDTLELYVRDEAGSAGADWDNVRLAINDVWGGYTWVNLGDYAASIGTTWTKLSIPLTDFPNIDFEHLWLMSLISQYAGPFTIGVDEVIFTGSGTPFVWMGEGHTDNDFSGGTAFTHELVTDGGVGAAPVYNEPPFVDAGSDQQIRYPEDSITLNGSAIDIDGTVAYYEWTQVSGPTPDSLTGVYSADLTVTASTFGEYVFRLSAEDDDGGVSEDDVILKVEDVGGYFTISHDTSNYRSIVVFHDVSWQDDENVVSGGNTKLEFYLKRDDLQSTIDWDAINFYLSDTTPLEVGIVVGDYVTTVDDQWVQVNVPLSVFSNAGLDLEHVKFAIIESAWAGPFVGLAVDEIRFEGGTAPFIWYGDDHPDNPFSVPSNMDIQFLGSGGVIPSQF